MVNCLHRWIVDPTTKEKVDTLHLCTDDLQITVIPQRALDIYELSYRNSGISYTDYQAKIVSKGFCETGSENFSTHFFAGMLTTCGLIQSGRPCQESGRKFGLHGCISNTPTIQLHTEILEDRVVVHGVIEEHHPEGESMQLVRYITLHQDNWIEIADTVKNIGESITPFMLMYHINFGAPFLSKNLQVSIPFSYIEDRDTGLPVPPSDILEIKPQAIGISEKVYYTKADMSSGARLFDPISGRECHLTAEGTSWVGIWENFVEGAYAFGIEPCNCPGLGRVNAAKRNLLPYLAPNESHRFRIRLQFTNYT